MNQPIVKSLIAWYLADEAIAALVEDRAYPVATVSGITDDCILIARISNPRIHTMSHGATGLTHPRVDVNCWSLSYSGAATLCEVVLDRTDSFRGMMGGTFIGSCLVEDEADILEPSPDLNAQQWFGRSLDLRIMHNEPKSRYVTSP